MNKKLKVGLLVGVPVLIGAYLIYKQFKGSKGAIGKYTPTPTPKPVVTPQRTTTQTSSGCDYPLKKGLYNCDLVKQLQWALNRIPYQDYDSTSNLVKYRPLAEDGDFGPKTEALVKDFGVGVEVDRNDMDVILSYVVEDPAQFQAAENPYVVAPTPTEPTQPTIDWNNPMGPTVNQ